jgi:hypothetical protein
MCVRVCVCVHTRDGVAAELGLHLRVWKMLCRSGP